MHTPTVSVLIPTYNYAQFLPKAIESVLTQTFTDFELVIVDDVSTDNTAEVVQPYLSDSRVAFYTNSKNLGLPGNWNRCLELSSGKYIKFLMADDVFHPQMLEKFTEIMNLHLDVSLVTSYKQYKDGDNNLLEKFQQPFSGWQKGERIIWESLKTWNWIGEPTTVMFRRENLSIGQFDEQLHWIPDWDMWLRQLTVGNCYIIPEVLSYFRQHEGQATVKVSNNIQRQSEEYFFYKRIREANRYGVDPQKMHLEKNLEDKSYKYLRASIRGLTGLKKRSLSVIGKAIAAFLKERLPLYGGSKRPKNLLSKVCQIGLGALCAQYNEGLVTQICFIF